MTLGCIGLGSMGTAIISGIRKKDTTTPIYAYVRRKNDFLFYAKENNVILVDSIEEMLKNVSALLLAIKPQGLDDLLPTLSNLPNDTLVISIAAGKPLAYYEQYFPKNPIIRVMPNINAAIQQSTTSFSANHLSQEMHKEHVLRIFSAIGNIEEIDEYKMAAYSAIAGASPAFTFAYIDALAKGGVAEGLYRKEALQAATLAVLGSAMMVLESKKHPLELLDTVTSPAGTTIEGIRALEENGFAYAVMEAVREVVKRDNFINQSK